MVVKERQSCIHIVIECLLIPSFDNFPNLFAISWITGHKNELHDIEFENEKWNNILLQQTLRIT